MSALSPLSISFTKQETLLILKAMEDFSLKDKGRLSNAFVEIHIMGKLINPSPEFIVFQDIDPNGLSEKLLRLNSKDLEMLIKLCKEYHKLPSDVDKMSWRQKYFH